MGTLGTEECPLRVAIIGSGPSGMFTAAALLDRDLRVSVDIFDRLHAPFGLVRYGVAPDHQGLKGVARQFDRVAQRDEVSFLGNVFVGQDIALDDLRPFYDAIIMATGAETNKRLNIPGEQLSGVHPAIQFVGWYNGHPDYSSATFDFSHESAVVIGNGNVALDVARILAKPIDVLSKSDIAAYALDALAESKIRQIHIVGRRGPVQNSFGVPELREMASLAGVPAYLDREYTAFADIDPETLSPAGRRQRMQTIEILGNLPVGTEVRADKRIIFHFLKSPVEIHGDGHVDRLVLAHNRLIGDSRSPKAEFTDEREILPAGLVISSVGYRGLPLGSLPFDEARGVIPHDEHRVQGERGVYAVGWVKRGAQGLIGSNKPDAADVAQALCADAKKLMPCRHRSTDDLVSLLAERGVRVIRYADWQLADAEERRRGEQVGKVREKIITREEFFGCIDG